MKRIFFFATRTDILTVTDAGEKRSPLKYVLEHHDLFPEYGSTIPRYQSAAEILTLGTATRRQTSNCERYIVAHESTPVEPFTRVIGGKSTTAYELGNCPDCIELTGGGFWEGTVLINGLLQTWSDSTLSQQLMRRFASAIKKTSKQKIGAYWIGPEAFHFLENGGRLTLNVEAAPSFDIKIQ
jgi:hypothetical protein